MSKRKGQQEQSETPAVEFIAAQHVQWMEPATIGRTLREAAKQGGAELARQVAEYITEHRPQLAGAVRLSLQQAEAFCRTREAQAV